MVTEVKRGTPAYEAGLNVDDEILAIDDYRVPPDGWRTGSRPTGRARRLTLLVARRERLMRLPVVFGEKPSPRWKLEVDPTPPPEQKARLDGLARTGAPAEE